MTNYYMNKVSNVYFQNGLVYHVVPGNLIATRHRVLMRILALGNPTLAALHFSPINLV